METNVSLFYLSPIITLVEPSLSYQLRFECAFTSKDPSIHPYRMIPQFTRAVQVSRRISAL